MRILKNIAKKTLIYTLIFLIICITCTPKATFASSTTEASGSAASMSEDELRDNFVNAIVNFYNAHASQCTYSVAGRTATYENGPDAGYYAFDCVGWVSCAFHWFLGIGNDFFSFFVDPTPDLYIDNGTYFEAVYDISQAKKGDVLVAIDQHVAIYIGDGQVLDMYMDRYGGLGIRNMNSTYSWDFVAHLYNFEGVNFTPVDGGANLPNASDEDENTGDWDTEEVDLDAIANVFVFDGMPPTIVYEDQKVDVFRWLFDGIGGFIDFIAGFLISFIKAPILGFAGMLDSYIDSLLSGMN